MRIDEGLVEEDDFDEEREGWTAEQVWEAMQDLLPLAPDPVVTHGDFSLDKEIRACPDARRITICYKPDNATARKFYASLGFVETNIDELGEMIAEILL